MAETYCGKSCLECTRQRELNCPGCRVGPGREVGGDCDLARCVRTRGHETCDTCVQRPRCGTYQGRERQPDYRIQRHNNDVHLQKAIADRAPFLGKWLWILFWLIVPSTIGSLMTQDVFKNNALVIYRMGQIINVACTLATALILLKLSQQEEDYRTAGICLLAGSIAGLLANLFQGDMALMSILIALPAAIVSIVGQYKEIMAHSAVLRGVDNELSYKWESLWKWFVGSMIGTTLSAFLVLVPIVGVLALLICTITLVVVSILKLVYLYKTAKAFREFDPVLMEG